jgi:hypothetical protein
MVQYELDLRQRALGQEIQMTGAMDKVFDIKLRRTVRYGPTEQTISKGSLTDNTCLWRNLEQILGQNREF